MEKKRILVLFGGCSAEYEVSLQSAHAVLTHLDPARFAALTVGITRQGQWLYYTGDIGNILTDAWQADRVNCLPCAVLPHRGPHQLAVFAQSPVYYRFDAAFPILHGKNGEDGTVQGLLELAGVPLVGCGCLASAVCMDKVRAHRLAAAAGIKTPENRVFGPDAQPRQWHSAARQLGWPVFVKPVRAGSSFGITRVEQPAQLNEAAAAAFAHDREILIEQAVPGFEVGCAVLGNDRLTVGRVDEIELGGGFFDYEEKYTLKTSRIHCPARLGPADEARVQQAAKTVYRALGCRGFARVDFFFTPEGQIVFNEVNTIPGFTAHSRYPGMMDKAGLGFTPLITRLVELGLEAQP